MTDQLRKRLARLDPMHPGVDTEPPSRELLEGIMSTPVVEQPETGPEQKSNRWLVGIAAAAALVLAVGGVIALTGGGTDPVASGPPLELTAAGSDPMAMCIVFSVEELAKAPLAFEGTATAMEGDTVTLDVDHWFKGGDASQVILNAPQGMEALIASIPFEVGGQYLITAYDGNVNYCGFRASRRPSSDPLTSRPSEPEHLLDDEGERPVRASPLPWSAHSRAAATSAACRSRASSTLISIPIASQPGTHIAMSGIGRQRASNSQ